LLQFQVIAKINFQVYHECEMSDNRHISEFCNYLFW
jgi:hypothetical protein